MAVPRALRRLLRVLDIEEEQSQLALKSALNELRRLEQLMVLTRKREREGRQCIVRSAYTGEVSDRVAGLQESQSAAQRAEVLDVEIAEVGLLVAELRQAYLGKRVERRQTEMLIRDIESGDAVVSARRNQQDLDDWYRNRLLARKPSAHQDRDDRQHQNREMPEEKL
jgi:hypothetical protein